MRTDPSVPTPGRSTDLATKSATARVFFARPSPRVITVACALTLLGRISMGGWSIVDAALAAGVVVLTGPVEWAIHKFLLHAKPTSFQMRRLGTGVNHHRHHLDPTDIDYILLRGADAALFTLLLAGFTAAWVLPILAVAGGPLAAPFLTALCVTYLTLANYEWTHLLAHTRHRPRTRLWSRLQRNHRFHHYRNERYWLGVTSNLGDRVFHTLPQNQADVARSDTARTLAP